MIFNACLILVVCFLWSSCRHYLAIIIATLFRQEHICFWCVASFFSFVCLGAFVMVCGFCQSGWEISIINNRPRGSRVYVFPLWLHCLLRRIVTIIAPLTSSRAHSFLLCCLVCLLACTPAVLPVVRMCRYCGCILIIGWNLNTLSILPMVFVDTCQALVA